MKNLFAVILICVLASFLFVGCIPVVPEDPEPTPILSAEISGIEFNDAGKVCCVITNTGDVPISFFELTFDVTLGLHKPIPPVVELYTEKLEVGVARKVCVNVGCPAEPPHTNVVSVKVTYELWE